VSSRRTRRTFLKTLATGAGLAAGWPGWESFARVASALPKSKPKLALPTVWSGAVTATSAVVKAWVPAGSLLRLAVAESGNPSRTGSFPPRAPVSGDLPNLLTYDVHGLRPDTVYSYSVEAAPNAPTPPLGRLRTFPSGAASFAFAFSSCANTGSKHPVFSTIASKEPLFFLHLGDLHYANIAKNDRALFQGAWQRVLGSPTQGALCRHIPFAYVWDDHDFGPNNSDATSPSRVAAQLTYREFMPHYPLAAGSGSAPIYQAFTAGRVRFLLTDLRSERSAEKMADGPRKSMLGAAQKKWFKEELLSAKASGAGLIVWASSVPFIGGAQKGDGWARYATERREIADFLKAHDIRNLCIVAGDAHMLAADNGLNSDYATGRGAPLRVMHGSSLDRPASYKGGPYSHGWYQPKEKEGCFGWVEITDTGSAITVKFSGRNHRDEEKVRLGFSRAGSQLTQRQFNGGFRAERRTT